MVSTVEGPSAVIIVKDDDNIRKDVQGDAASEDHCGKDIVSVTRTGSALYDTLKDLPFPALTTALSTDIKQQLLSPKLRRQVQTKELVEFRNSNKIGKFQPVLTEKHLWLFMGNSGGYCIYCKLFCTRSSKPRRSGEFTALPYTSYSRSKLCQDHERTSYHKAACVSATEFIAIAKGKRHDIKTRIAGNAATLAKRKERLHTVVKALVCCGKQGIALRGHRNESFPSAQAMTIIEPTNKHHIIQGDVNRGNFLHLLKFRGDSGDIVVSHVINNRASYTCSGIQNRLLLLISTQITDEIIARLGNGFFTIIADESSDVSNQEQLCLAIRYLGMNSIGEPKVEERFLKFITIYSVTGQAIADVILEEVHGLNIDMKRCRGQSYDGAANMSGATRGAATIISSQYPMAKYQHCQSHCLNLSLMKACTAVAEISHIWQTQSHLCTFFSRSAKRQHLLEKTIEATESSNHKTKLHSLSRTRWVERYQALENTLSLLPSIVETLESITRDASYDATSSATAVSLLRAVTSFGFITGLTICHLILTVTNNLCVKLQGRSIDVALATKEVNTVQRRIETYRSDVNAFHDTWYQEAKRLAEELNIAECVPRRCGRQTVRNNVPALSGNEYYKRAITIPMLDILSQELSSRFSSSPEVLLLMPSSVVQPRWRHFTGVNSWESLVVKALEPYRDDLPTPLALSTEVKCWWSHWWTIDSKGETVPDSAVKAFIAAKDLSLPNIETILHIVCVSPITSSEAERAFSRMKLIKSSLRNTMTTPRLSSLSSIAIHRDINIDVTDVVNKFINKT